MRFLSPKTLESIYFSGILLSVLYCISIWGSSSRLSEVNKIHVRAARFIKKLSKKNWKPIAFYYKRAVACKAYTIYNGLSPSLLQNLLSKSNTRATRNKLKVNHPSFKYSLFKNSFTYRASVIWNNLPNNVRDSTSFNAFKYSLRDINILNKITFGSIARAPDSNYIYY